MRAGRLRHRIELREPTETKDNLGQDVLSFSTAATVFGAIEPLTGKEFVEREISVSELTAKIVIRYYSGINTKWRVKHGTTIYEIKSIINSKMIKRELILMVKEIPSGAV